MGITDGFVVTVQFNSVQRPCQDLLSKSHCPCSRTSLCLANGCCYEGTVPSLSGSHLTWMFVCWWEVFELCAKFKWSIRSWNSGMCTCSLSFPSLLSVATSCDVKCCDVAVSLKSCYSNIFVRILELAGIKSTLLVQIHSMLICFMQVFSVTLQIIVSLNSGKVSLTLHNVIVVVNDAM